MNSLDICRMKSDPYLTPCTELNLEASLVYIVSYRLVSATH